MTFPAILGKRTSIAAGIATAGAAASTAVVAIAAADPVWPIPGAESASATIADVQAQGYLFRINWVTGTTSVPPSRCTVSGIHNPVPRSAKKR